MKIEFTEDYGNSKKGTVMNATSVLAGSLLRKKVAKVFVEKEEKPAKAKKEKEPKTEE